MIRSILFDISALLYGPTGPDFISEILRAEAINVEPVEVTEAIQRLPAEVAALRKEIRTEEQENEYHHVMLPYLLANLGVHNPNGAKLIRLAEEIHGYSGYFSLYPETLPVLEALKQRGFIMGVLSNWEPSLSRFVKEFELDGYFAAVTSSMAEGVAKPDPILFHRALKAAGMKAEETLHVGPSIEEDVTGAMQAGIRPIWLNRTGIPTDHEVLAINDLRGLLLLAQKAGE